MRKFTTILLIFVLSTVSVFATDSLPTANESIENSEITDETGIYTESEEPTTENNPVQEAELTEDENYNTENELSQYSEPVQDESSINLQSETTEPEEIPQLTISSNLINDTSVKLSWTLTPTSDATFIVKKIGAREEVFQTTKTEMIFNNLDIGETYTFKVIYNDIEESVSVTTPSLQTPSITAYAAYKGISLEWTAVPNASSYELYRDGKLISAKAVSPYYDRTNSETDKHSYYVIAVPKSGKKSSRSNTVSKSPVRPMYITVVFKKKVKLTSHDGKNIKKTFKAGQKVTAHGYGSGKYKFYYNGHLYHAKNLRVKNAKALYTTSFNYSAKDAEAFVNSIKATSPTSWLIWVSEYTQRVYIFKRNQGKWTVYNSWEIASGKASTPSPKSLNKSIHKKIKSHHGLGSWSCYSSMNAFHGKRSSWKVGKPASNGCIRNPNDKAKWIYKNIPLRTKVIIY